jgi:short-subunit dehydrogenase
VPSPGFSVYNATKFGILGFGLAMREELWGTGVGVSVVCPTFVNEAGMWAETGLKANPMAGEVSPAKVADAVWKAIVQNRAEVDVMPIQLRASIKIMAVAPRLFAAVARSSGATKPNERVEERQKHKR